jgi:hypothetical protein
MANYDGLPRRRVEAIYRGFARRNDAERAECAARLAAKTSCARAPTVAQMDTLEARS